MQQTVPWQSKIEALQTELKALKSLAKEANGSKKKVQKKKPQVDNLRGILKGINFSVKEIDQVQEEIFDFKEIK